MKLILTGGGDSRYFREIDQYFIKLIKKNPSLLFVPIAGEKRNWKGGLKRLVETFSTITFDRVEICSNLKNLDWDYLKEFGAIYFDGGNTFQLMSKIRDTHTYELLNQFLYHGGVINGDSAGAIILGSHLETAHFGNDGDENETALVSYQGLNLMGKWAVHCHYKKSERKEIQKFVNEYGFPVLALNDRTSVFYNGKTIKVLGNKEATVFTGDEVIEVHPGDYVRVK